jgi:hypothetical protein
MMKLPELMCCHIDQLAADNMMQQSHGLTGLLKSYSLISSYLQ